MLTGGLVLLRPGHLHKDHLKNVNTKHQPLKLTELSLEINLCNLYNEKDEGNTGI